MKEKNKKIIDLLQLIQNNITKNNVLFDIKFNIEKLEGLIRELIEESEKPHAHERAPF